MHKPCGPYVPIRVFGSYHCWNSGQAWHVAGGFFGSGPAVLRTLGGHAWEMQLHGQLSGTDCYPAAPVRSVAASPALHAGGQK